MVRVVVDDDDDGDGDDDYVYAANDLFNWSYPAAIYSILPAL